MLVKQKRLPSELTKNRISDGVKKYHKECRDNAAKLAKLTKNWKKEIFFINIGRSGLNKKVNRLLVHFSFPQYICRLTFIAHTN